jgi:hypothetical protein
MRNDRILVHGKIEMTWKNVIVATFKALRQYLIRGRDENHEKHTSTFLTTRKHCNLHSSTRFTLQTE